jgi:GT2 family glycosyltransferase
VTRNASICIPTRNRPELLRRTLESLNAQSVEFDRFQVIVGDDGTTDATPDLLHAFKAHYQLGSAWVGGRGSGAARNAAASAARHDVLIFLDDDQIASPDLVAVHLRTQERLGRVIVQGNYPLAAGWDRRGASLVVERSRRQSLRATRPGNGRGLWGGNFSVPKSIWLEVGGFDEGLPRHQDLDFGLRVARLGVPMVIEGRALSHHLHCGDPDEFRRHCLDQGRCRVRISQKLGMPLGTSGPRAVDRALDRLVKEGWRRFPRQAERIGRWLTAALRTSDFFQLRPAQLLAARLVGRFHRLGGMALEASATDTVGVGRRSFVARTVSRTT